MIHVPSCLIGVVLAAAAPLCAQRQVFVVDAAGGPGSNFSDLPAAVLAAQSGDVLLVRPGDYAGFRTGKGLTILGGSGVRLVRSSSLFAPALQVMDLPANESFTLLGFETVPSTSFFPRMEISSCAGQVHLEGIHNYVTWRSIFPNSSAALQIENAASVTIVRSQFLGQPGVLARNSTVVVTDSECEGMSGLINLYEFLAGHGIRAESSHVTLSRSSAVGGSYYLDPPSSAAGLGYGLSSHLSTWTILGDTTTHIDAGSAPGFVASAMHGTGSVRMNPVVAFVPSGNAPPIDPLISATNLQIPSLRATGAPLGGSVAVDVFGSSGDAFGLFVGLPGVPISLGALGEFWIDLGSGAVFVMGGVIDGSRHFAVNFAVPNDPLVLGTRFTWQAIGGSIANEFFLSNPATYVHP